VDEDLFVGFYITGGTEVQAVAFRVPPSIFSAFVERVVGVSAKGDNTVKYGVKGVYGVYRSIGVSDGEHIRRWWG